MSYIIRAASPDDAVIIAPLLREADKNEIDAMTGWTPVDGLRVSIENSDEAWFVTRPDGSPILVAGVGDDMLGVGIPWMLGTPLVTQYGKSVVKLGREWVQRWTDKYNYLWNFADSRNTVHLNWLSHIGFTVESDDQFIGHDPYVPFHRFYRSN
jgi:hypothetical protein